MLIVGSILWGLLLLGLFALAIPSPMMRRDKTGNATYYMLWVFMIGLTLLVHYQYMLALHQRMLAGITDLTALLLFLGSRLLSHLVIPREGGGDGRIQYYRSPGIGPAGLPDIRLDSSGTYMSREGDQP